MWKEAVVGDSDKIVAYGELRGGVVPNSGFTGFWDEDGYFVMSDDWFTEYTYQVVVHKKYLTAEELAAYEADPIMLEPWDPMGSLAK